MVTQDLEEIAIPKFKKIKEKKKKKKKKIKLLEWDPTRLLVIGDSRASELHEEAMFEGTKFRIQPGLCLDDAVLSARVQLSQHHRGLDTCFFLVGHNDITDLMVHPLCAKHGCPEPLRIMLPNWSNLERLPRRIESYHQGLVKEFPKIRFLWSSSHPVDFGAHNIWRLERTSDHSCGMPETFIARDPECYPHMIWDFFKGLETWKKYLQSKSVPFVNLDRPIFRAGYLHRLGGSSRIPDLDMCTYDLSAYLHDGLHPTLLLNHEWALQVKYCVQMREENQSEMIQQMDNNLYLEIGISKPLGITPIPYDSKKDFNTASEPDDLDLTHELYPLGHYVSDRQDELVAQMFSIVKSAQIEAMLPPVLKGIPLKELKQLCLHELRGMSKNRILCIVNGQEMDCSSGSEEEEDDDEEQDEKMNQAKAAVKSAKKGIEETAASLLGKKIKTEPGLNNNQGDPSEKSILELLELEMRARMIKTMLEKTDEGNDCELNKDKHLVKKDAKNKIHSFENDKNIVSDVGRQSRRTVISRTNVNSDDKRMNADGRRQSNLAIKKGSNNADSLKTKNTEIGISKVKNLEQFRNEDRSRERKNLRKRLESEDEILESRDRRNRTYRGHKERIEETEKERKERKKKKITRREFEERMKRAKMNRSYRSRRGSDDDKIIINLEDSNDVAVSNSSHKIITLEDRRNMINEAERRANEEKFEHSEKEEGELDSNEEEEGVCSPSEISSVSNYSIESIKGRKKKDSRLLQAKSFSSRSRSSRSRSNSNSRSRSFSRSRSPSLSRVKVGREIKRGETFKARRGNNKNYKGKVSVRKEPERDKNDTIVSCDIDDKDDKDNDKENWGQVCDIELVDSEEDFDNEPVAAVPEAKIDTVELKKIPRQNISFSIQKKAAPNINLNRELDDLPLKNVVASEIPEENFVIKEIKPKRGPNEIVISSDSEMENEDSENKTEKILHSKYVNKNNGTSLGTSSPLNVKTPGNENSMLFQNVNSNTVQGTEYVSSKIFTDSRCRGVDEGSENKNEQLAHSFKTAGKRESHGELNQNEKMTGSVYVGHSSANEIDTISGRIDNDKQKIVNTRENIVAKYQEISQKTINDIDRAEQQNANLKTSIQNRSTHAFMALGVTEIVKNVDEHNMFALGSNISLNVVARNKIMMDKNQVSNGTKIEKNIDAITTKSSGLIGMKVDSAGSLSNVEVSPVKELHSTGNSTQNKCKKNESETIDKNNVHKNINELNIREECMNQKDEIDREMEFNKGNYDRPPSTEKELINEDVVEHTKDNVTDSKDSVVSQGEASINCSRESSEETDGETAHAKYVSSSPENLTLTDTETPESYVDDNQDNTTPGQSRSGAETEIIGVIETNTNQVEDVDLEGSNWNMRWLQSDKVQKVVSSSKMLSRVRKKIQINKASKTFKPAPKSLPVSKPTDKMVSVIGSIEEYERLFGKASENYNSAASRTTSSQNPDTVVASQNEASILRKQPVLGSDDEGDDSEDDELWSKIMGK